VGWDNQAMDVLSLRHGSPHVTASGKTLHYIPNIRVPEATGSGYNRERKIWQFCGQMMENSLIPASGLSEAG
jgi:hypothetical protein